MNTTVTLPDARVMIERCIRANLVPNLLGSPGCGKSALIHQIAEEFNLKVIDLRLSQCEPQDVLGFPNIDEGRNKAGYVPMETFPIEGDELPINPKTDQKYSGWLLFLDEANGADTSTTKASYKLINDKMVGVNHLHKNVAIVCAGNLVTDNALVEEQGTAMQSRLVHMVMKVDPEAWLVWARANGIDYRITSWIEFKPSELFKFDPENDDLNFRSPRTWDFTSRLIKGITELTPLDRILMAGTISETGSSAFYAYTKVFEDLPTAKQICAAPMDIQVPREPSTSWALTGALGQYATADNIEPIMKYVNRIPKEFQIVAMKEIARQTPKLKSSAPVVEWVTQNAHEYF